MCGRGAVAAATGGLYRKSNLAGVSPPILVLEHPLPKMARIENVFLGLIKIQEIAATFCIRGGAM